LQQEHSDNDEPTWRLHNGPLQRGVQSSSRVMDILPVSGASFMLFWLNSCIMPIGYEVCYAAFVFEHKTIASLAAFSCNLIPG
jgi:hypothetical protein